MRATRFIAFRLTRRLSIQDGFCYLVQEFKFPEPKTKGSQDTHSPGSLALALLYPSGTPCLCPRASQYNQSIQQYRLQQYSAGSSRINIRESQYASHRSFATSRLYKSLHCEGNDSVSRLNLERHEIFAVDEIFEQPRASKHAGS